MGRGAMPTHSCCLTLSTKFHSQWKTPKTLPFNAHACHNIHVPWVAHLSHETQARWRANTMSSLIVHSEQINYGILAYEIDKLSLIKVEP